MKPLAVCLVLLTTGCLVPKHDSFATPQDAVLTFQSRLARDDVAGEVECFSDRFREANGASLQVYATVRDRFLEPLGTIGRFVLRHDSLEDNLEGGSASELHVRLVYSLFGHAFEITAAPEAAFRFPDPESGEPLTAPLPRQAARIIVGASPDDVQLAVAVNVPTATAHAIAARGLPWAELVNGWKLEGLAPIEGKPSVKALPPAAAGASRTVRAPALRVKERPESFGTVELRLAFPLGEACHFVRTLPDGTIRVGSPASADPPAPELERLHFTFDAVALR